MPSLDHLVGNRVVDAVHIAVPGVAAVLALLGLVIEIRLVTLVCGQMI